ncbi:MAG TPA: DUF4384 domain-containing protein [Pyrinomonadaceae bacterium]
MRLRTPMLTLAALALAVCAGARAQEQPPPPQQDQQVIDDFVTTRGMGFTGGGQKTQAKPAPTPRRSSSAGKGSGGGVASSKPGGKGSASGKSGKSTTRPGVGGSGGVTAQTGGEPVDEAGAKMLKASAEAVRPMALGYTVLMKDGVGRLSVVDATHEFKTGDSIAIALETNADGYLYMFNASDGRNPELLFPNAQLDGGANSLQAHARATFPADLSYDFRFTDPAAKEHLFVVLSREPLAGVPTGAALVEFCGASVEDCAWKPPASLWERIKGGAKVRGVIEAKNMQLAQASQPVMPQMLQRGLKVKKEDPKPAVVRVNNSPDADILVTEIVLIHK